MPRAASARRSGEIRIVLTSDQVRDFAACAAACDLTIERWVVECAQVQSAAVIDAVQATERRKRSHAREAASSKPVNIRRRRAARGDQKEPPP